MSEVDYKAILKKYMRLVLSSEGWSYLSDAEIGKDQWEFTKEEFAYLEGLANEVES